MPEVMISKGQNDKLLFYVPKKAPWDLYRMDYQSGINRVELSLDGKNWEVATGTLKWSYTTGGEIFSSPAIAPNGTI